MWTNQTKNAQSKRITQKKSNDSSNQNHHKRTPPCNVTDQRSLRCTTYELATCTTYAWSRCTTQELTDAERRKRGATPQRDPLPSNAYLPLCSIRFTQRMPMENRRMPPKMPSAAATMAGAAEARDDTTFVMFVVNPVKS